MERSRKWSTILSSSSLETTPQTGFMVRLLSFKAPAPPFLPLPHSPLASYTARNHTSSLPLLLRRAAMGDFLNAFITLQIARVEVDNLQIVFLEHPWKERDPYRELWKVGSWVHSLEFCVSPMGLPAIGGRCIQAAFSPNYPILFAHEMPNFNRHGSGYVLYRHALFVPSTHCTPIAKVRRCPNYVSLTPFSCVMQPA